MFGYQMSDYDKKVYNEELRDFLPEKIIDSHAHCWRVEDDEYDRSKFPKKWTNLVAKDCYIEDLLKTYNTLFDGKKVIPVIFGNSVNKCLEHNAYVKSVSEKYSFPSLFWTRYEMAPEFIEEQVVKGGFQGLKPYLGGCKQGVNPNEAEIYDFLPKSHLEIANKYGWKVVLHISKSQRLKDECNLKTLLDIEQKFPNVKLIVAHIGRAYTSHDVGDAFEALSKTQNMLFDFSANTNSKIITKCIETFGIKRVLFGTDMPIAKMKMRRIEENGTYINVIPKGLYGDVSNDVHMRESLDENITNFTYEILRAFKTSASELTLNRKDIEDIMCNNAQSLYNVKF